MAKFVTNCDLRVLNRNLWMLVEPFRVELDAVESLVVSVPKGFITDLSSVPRIPFAYWTVGGRARKAGVVHDYLYQTHPSTISRSTADKCFYEIAILEEERAVAYIMWSGIRIGGLLAWWSGPERFLKFQNSIRERRSVFLRPLGKENG